MTREAFRNIVLWSVLAVSTMATNVAFANGESIDGFPNWSERTLLEWMNRARSDPQADLAACPSNACLEKACYATASPPRYMTDDLNHSSRFHSSEMVLDNFFDHYSECTLVSNIANLYTSQPQQCDGTASCACAGGTRNAGAGGGTDPFSRMSIFGESEGEGEIIAAGYQGPDATFYGWEYEGSSTSSCGFNAQNGHRYLILTDGNGENAGAGYTTGASNYGTYATMDFGGSAPAKPKIPSGSHYPQQAASVDAWVNWFDTAGPSVAKIDVDGTCSAMTLTHGSQANGAWHLAVANVGSSCHHYVFSFKDSGGAEQIYPTTGAFSIGDGSAQCPDFSESPPTGCAGFDRIFVNSLEY